MCSTETPSPCVPARVHVAGADNIRTSTEVRDLAVCQHRSMQPDVQYVRCGDGFVAYTLFGNGPVDLVPIFADLTHLEFAWRDPGLARFIGRLADWSRLISSDKRGFGLSDRITVGSSIDDRVEEIRIVLDEVGSGKAPLSSGCGRADRWRSRSPPLTRNARIRWFSTAAARAIPVQPIMTCCTTARSWKPRSAARLSTGATLPRSRSRSSHRAASMTPRFDVGSPSCSDWVAVPANTSSLRSGRSTSMFGTCLRRSASLRWSCTRGRSVLSDRERSVPRRQHSRRAVRRVRWRRPPAVRRQ